MKKYSLITLYNFIAIIILFLLLELAVRIFVPQIKLSGTSSNLITDSLYSDSPGIKSMVVGYSGGVVKKSNEYHSWKYFKPVSTSARKILFLGDSVTMGIGVDNDSTYAGIINNSSGNISIINPSLIGYSSKDYLNVFDYFVKQKENNLKFSDVILFWTLNDIYSNYPNEKSPEFSSGNFLNSIINFFRKNSKAYHFLKNLFSDRALAYYEYDEQFYTASNTFLQNSLKNIERISSACDSLKIKFRLVLLPYEYQIRNFNQFGIFKPQQLLEQELKNKDIEIIDLKEAFKNGINSSAGYYLYGDGIHFNEGGNALIAGYLKKYF